MKENVTTAREKCVARQKELEERRDVALEWDSAATHHGKGIEYWQKTNEEEDEDGFREKKKT